MTEVSKPDTPTRVASTEGLGLAPERAAFDWDRKGCPCLDVQLAECQAMGCKWERDPALVPQHLRRPPENCGTELEALRAAAVDYIRAADRAWLETCEMAIQHGISGVRVSPAQAAAIEKLQALRALLKA
jgi:hypothetical protein